MYKKSKNRTLILVFIVLLIIVAAYKFIDYRRGDRTFTSNIMKIDTSAITVINFFPKSTQFKQVEMYRSGKSWNIKYNNNTWSADPVVIRSIFSQVADMKAERIAATDNSKWKELGVSLDDGIRVKIEENNKLDADFIVGKISYSQSQNPYYQRGSVNTYIRLINSKDDKVYAVNGYLGMIFNRDVSIFRNGLLLNMNKNNFRKLSFIYEGDSSFILAKKDNVWMVDDKPADSASVQNYLNSIAHLNSNEFADDFNIYKFTKPEWIVNIEGSNYTTAVIKGFPAKAPLNYVLTSSVNEDMKFRGDKNDLFKRVFVGKHKLMPK